MKVSSRCSFKLSISMSLQILTSPTRYQCECLLVFLHIAASVAVIVALNLYVVLALVAASVAVAFVVAVALVAASVVFAFVAAWCCLLTLLLFKWLVDVATGNCHISHVLQYGHKISRV